MATVFLALGSNTGNRLNNLKTAVKLLKENVEIVNISSVYETEPVGVKEQPWFYNAVIEIKTTLEPFELLKICKGIEDRMGRGKSIKWGPRNIDIDILLYGNQTVSDGRLAIPHPELQKRAFVLIPLVEISPQLILPDGKKACDILAEISLPEKVLKTKKRLT